MTNNSYYEQAEQSKIKNIIFSEEFIRQLHSRNLTNSTLTSGYRTIHITPVETPHRIAEPNDIPHLMNHYISQVTISSYSLHPIEVAAMAYKRFLDIYPFEQANEETAVAIASFLLQQAGYYFIGIPVSFQAEYKKAILYAQKTGIPDDLITLFSKIISLNQ